MVNSIGFDWGEVLPEPPVGPALYWRHRWTQYNTNPGLPFSRGTLQNRDAAGLGPESLVIGGKVAYTREALIRWLNQLEVKHRASSRAGGGRADAVA